jgi:phosphoadenosine phosphosulfate reductase
MSARAEAARAARELEGAPAEVILRWAVDRYAPRLAVATSMTDTVLVHLATRTWPDVPVLFADTGYHFEQTLRTRDEAVLRYGLRLVSVTPAQTVAEQDATHGPALHQRDPDRCCALRKVDPLNRTLRGYDAWVTGARRGETAARADLPIVEWDARRGLVKVNPLAGWTDAEVDRHVERHGLLVNPLVAAGYPSIGCAPCTRRVADGEDPRAGRWAGSAKTECGLHA